MCELVKNNNHEMTALEKDSVIESKDDKSKIRGARRSSVNFAVVRGISGVVKWFSAYKGFLN